MKSVTIILIIFFIFNSSVFNINATPHKSIKSNQMSDSSHDFVNNNINSHNLSSIVNLDYSISGLSSSDIVINSNPDFLTYASSGNGTKSSPYLIENYSLSYSSVFISNTSAYFILQNVSVAHRSYGFYLTNVQNGMIINCTAKDTSNAGFQLFYSSNNHLINNSASGDYNGFVLFSSNNITLTDNIASSNNNGILLQSSFDNLFLNNSVNNNDEGIMIHGLSSTGNSFIHNSIVDNSEDAGFYLDGALHNNFINNTIDIINYANYGFYLFSASNNLFQSNTVKNSVTGFYLLSSMSNTMTNNSVSNVNYAFNLDYHSIDNNVTYNSALNFSVASVVQNNNNNFYFINTPNKFFNNEFSPNTPVNISIASTETTIELHWDAPNLFGGPNITGYQIFRKECNSVLCNDYSYSNFTFIATSMNLKFIDHNVTKGNTYYYFVKAINVLGASPNSTITYQNYDPYNYTPIPFSIDYSIKDERGNHNVILKWQGNGPHYAGPVTTYQIYRADSFLGNFKYIGSTTNANYTDLSVTNGKSYYYYVKAVNSDGSADSQTILVSVPVTPLTLFDTIGVISILINLSGVIVLGIYFLKKKLIH